MTPVRLRRSWSRLGPSFARLATAGLLSDVGGASTVTAVMLHVFHVAHERTAVLGWSALGSLSALVVGGAVGGRLAERGSRQALMVMTDLLRIPIVLALGRLD